MNSRALISVYDKTNIVELAQFLVKQGIEIVSTGSTAQTMRQAGVSVLEVAEVTEFPEILDGRVKTLHPHIHGGILARRSEAHHRAILAEHKITPIDMVISNLYPFEATVNSGASQEEIIENIDIGGPTLIRAAAKNYSDVTIVVDPGDYPTIMQQLSVGTGIDLLCRKELAAKAFRHIAHYDQLIAEWFTAEASSIAEVSISEKTVFPLQLAVSAQFVQTLRYGENPHQAAAIYSDNTTGIATARVLSGKEMSFNNFVDADAAWRCVHDFAKPAAAIIKHANPCGIAVGDTIESAYLKAHETDSISAYGGVIALNRPVTLALAELIKPVFTEVVIAPEFTAEALELLSVKKNLRLVALADYIATGIEIRPISGGFLLQEKDQYQAVGDNSANWTLAAGPAASESILHDLEFAWTAVRAVKSNAILLAQDEAAIGIGMGQVNRVDAAELAVKRSGGRITYAVAASDAFFPFVDGLEILIRAGVRAVVQPGGSIRDDESIALANQHNVTMYFTDTRHFAH